MRRRLPHIRTGDVATSDKRFRRRIYQPDVRSGSLADKMPSRGDVRFTPESGHEEVASGSFPAPRFALLEKGVRKGLARWSRPGRRTNHEWQGDGFCGGRAPREHVLDRAGATKLLRWQPCRLAAHGRRGGVPMKRRKRRSAKYQWWDEINTWPPRRTERPLSRAVASSLHGP